MKKGLSRFEYFLSQLEILLTKASEQKNPALWLYVNNARTPLFMLEGLAKMYSGLHNPKKFAQLKEQFKLLEDTLGSIDYYDSFAKEFSNNKKIPAAVTTYIQAQVREKIQSLNEILVEKEWINNEKSRISKIRKKLSEADWMKEKKEVKAISEFYGKAIYEIVEFVSNTGFQFKNVEKDVHEMRRKLRWLSIYPQATRGIIQLSKAKKIPGHLSKYLTKEITSSPFNKMPDAADNSYFLLLEQHYFYSLSWMIAELGKLKDNGLRIVILKEALQQGTTTSDAAAFKKAYQLTDTKQPTLPQLLNIAEGISRTYFKEQNLEHLVMGTGTIK